MIVRACLDDEHGLFAMHYLRKQKSIDFDPVHILRQKSGMDITSVSIARLLKRLSKSNDQVPLGHCRNSESHMPVRVD